MRLLGNDNFPKREEQEHFERGSSAARGVRHAHKENHRANNNSQRLALREDAPQPEGLGVAP